MLLLLLTLPLVGMAAEAETEGIATEAGTALVPPLPLKRIGSATPAPPPCATPPTSLASGVSADADIIEEDAVLTLSVGLRSEAKPAMRT